MLAFQYEISTRFVSITHFFPIFIFRPTSETWLSRQEAVERGGKITLAAEAEKRPT